MSTTPTLQITGSQLAELDALREENALLRAALNLAAADAATGRPSNFHDDEGISSSTDKRTKAISNAFESHIEVGGDGHVGLPSSSSMGGATPSLQTGAKVGPEAGVGLPTGPPPCARYFGVGHLHRDEVERYSRQALLPHFGSQGCRDLLNSRVLVVGAGGLGSTIIPYLAAAGVGYIRIVDLDTVDRSNLHRQIIHTDERVGVPKAISAEITANEINPTIKIDAVIERFDVFNASTLLEGVDVVLDATDNVASRYIINDACVFAGKPLVSGGATRWEGQITVYHFAKPSTTSNSIPSDDTASVDPMGPCYRCLFPEPTPPSMVGNCNDVGVVGPVPGMIGCLQALEAIKVLLQLGEHHKLNSQRDQLASYNQECVANKRPEGIDVMAGKMLMFDGLRGTFRTIKLRPRQPGCRVCGSHRKVHTIEEAFSSGEFPEYIPVGCNIALPFETAVIEPALEEQLSTKKEGGGGVVDEAGIRVAVQRRMKETCVLDLSLVLPSVGALADMEAEQQHMQQRSANNGLITTPNLPVFLLDVRVPEQYHLCGIPGALSMPLSEIEADPTAALSRICSVMDERQKRKKALLPSEGGKSPEVVVEDIYVICRRGINSMKAVKLLGAELVKADLGGIHQHGSIKSAAVRVGSVVNIQGGLGMWGSEVDSNFPLY